MRSEEVVSLLQSNPALRAAVLSALDKGNCAKCGQSGVDEMLCCGPCTGGMIAEQLTAAEAELATERARVRELTDVINFDRTGLAAGLNHVVAVVKGYQWIADGHWGSYDYTQRTVETLQREVAHLIKGACDGATRALKASGERATAAVRAAQQAAPPPVEQAKDSAPSGQKAENNVGPESEPGNEGREPHDGSATTEQREARDAGLAGSAAGSTRDDRRAEGGAEEPRASTGYHQVGGSAALGRRSDDGGLTRVPAASDGGGDSPAEPQQTAKALNAVARAATILLMGKSWSVDEHGNEVLSMSHGTFYGRSRIEAERLAADALPEETLRYAVSGAAVPQPTSAGTEGVTHLEARALIDTLHRRSAGLDDDGETTAVVQALLRYLVQQEQAESERDSLRGETERLQGELTLLIVAAEASVAGRYDSGSQLMKRVTAAKAALEGDDGPLPNESDTSPLGALECCLQATLSKAWNGDEYDPVRLQDVDLRFLKRRLSYYQIARSRRPPDNELARVNKARAAEQHVLRRRLCDQKTELRNLGRLLVTLKSDFKDADEGHRDARAVAADAWNESLRLRTKLEAAEAERQHLQEAAELLRRCERTSENGGHSFDLVVIHQDMSAWYERDQKRAEFEALAEKVGAPEVSVLATTEEPHDLEFGCDPGDSAALLKLREAIDSADLWPSEAVKESGDYEAAVGFMARLARLEPGNPDEPARSIQLTDLSSAAEALLDIFHLYGGYTVTSRGPIGLIHRALKVLHPEAQAMLSGGAAVSEVRDRFWPTDENGNPIEPNTEAGAEAGGREGSYEWHARDLAKPLWVNGTSEASQLAYAIMKLADAVEQRVLRAEVTALIDARIAELATAAAEKAGKLSMLGWPLSKLAEVAGERGGKP